MQPLGHFLGPCLAHIWERRVGVTDPLCEAQANETFGNLSSTVVVHRDFFALDGVSSHYRTLVSELVDLGHDVVVVTHARCLSTSVYRGARVVGIPYIQGRLPVSSTLASDLALRWALTVRDFLLGVKPQVVISPIVGAQNVIAEFLPEAHHICTLHTPYRARGEGGSRRDEQLRRLQISALSSASILVANSDSIRHQLGDLDAAHIPHGIQDLPLGQSEGNGFLWVGRLDWRKGGDRFIELVSLLNGRVPLTAVISPGRNDPKQVRALKAMARKGIVSVECGVSDEGLMKLVDECRCVLSTSRRESFGLIALEAARRQRGLIGLECPGISEVLPEGNGGMWVAGIPDLCELMLDLTNDELISLGLSARSRFLSNYQSSQMARSFSKLIRQLA